MASLLTFLEAAADSYRHRNFTLKQNEPDSDSNESLFPPSVVLWAYHHDQDLSMLRLEIEEAGKLIREDA